MKVAIHIHGLAGGGAERIAAILCSELAGRGHQVLLITQLPAGPSDYVLDGRVERLCIGATSTRRRWLRATQRVRRLRGALREFKAEVVLGFMTTSSLYATIAGIGTGVRVLCCERVDPKQQSLSAAANRARRWLFPWAELVVVQTQGASTWLTTQVPRATGCVIPNPVQYPLTEASPAIQPETVLGEDAVLVLGVGRLDLQKGFDRLIEAFSDLASEIPATELVILGEGEQRAELQVLINRHNLADRIHLPGRAGNLPAWYKRAALFVLASRSEGFPNALAEAMAYGCAVLAIDCDFGPAELIENGHNGILLPTDSTAALRVAMSQLLSDDSLRRTLGANAQAVRNRYNVEKVLDRWESVLTGQGGSVVEH